VTIAGKEGRLVTMVDEGPRPNADYLPEPLYPGFVDPEAPTSAPEPGTGTVWVIPPEGNGPWGAAWVAEGAAKLANLRGPQEAVVAWALAQPAVRWLTPVLQTGGNFDWGDLKPSR
jgi:hypothetical protein